MTDAHYFILVLIIGFGAWVYSTFIQIEASESQRNHVRVEWVKDGDSFRIKAPKNTDIRLWGIDAPEKGEEGAEKARNALIQLIKGKRISYKQIDTDRYGRIVARVFLPDGREVNRLLIEQGVVSEYCRYSTGFYGQC